MTAQASGELSVEDVEVLRCVAGAQVAFDDGPGPSRLVRGRAFINRKDLTRLERRGLLLRRRARWGSGVLVEITARGREALVVAEAEERMRLADEQLRAELASSESEADDAR